MHTTRYALRPAASTCGGRAAARCVPNAARGISHWATAPSPYARAAHSDFASLFRLLDDASSRAFDPFLPAIGNSVALRAANLPTFQPRFDVREGESAYELRGELPGVKPEDLSVEFTDAQTLVIKGRSARETTTGTAPAADSEAVAAAAAAAAAADNTSDTASVLSASSYQKPSVEDAAETAADDTAESSASGAVNTPTSSVAATPATAEPAATTPQETTPSAQDPSIGRYWMSERSVGEFQRTFSFPARVDHDGVRASLKDGLLSLTVPKAAAPETRRINVE